MLAILPSSLLSRVFPGSERESFTSIRGPRRAPPERTLDRGFSSGRFARTSPKIVPNLFSGYTEKCGKNSKNGPIGRRDLAAQRALRHIVRKDSQRTLSGNGIHRVLVFLTQIWPCFTQKKHFFQILRQNPYFLLLFIARGR